MKRSRTFGMTIALAALFAAASGADARDDDVAFALGLAQRGYEDLADAEIDLMLTKNPTPERKQNALYSRCELKRRSALRLAGNDKSDPSAVREQFAAAGEAFTKYLSQFPKGKYAADAEFAGANLKKAEAYFLNKEIEKFPASERGAIRKEAEDSINEAIRLLKAIRDREHKKDEGKDWNDDTKWRQRNIAWYHLTVALYDRGTLLPPGDPVRVQQLTEAIDETMLYLEETDGSIFGYFACMYLGLAHWKRGENENGWVADDIRQAKDWIEVTVDAADLQGVETWPALLNVIFMGAKHYGEMCNSVGSLEGTNYPRLFVEKMERVEAKLPSIRKNSLGMQALIAKCQSQARTGEYAKAIESLNSISIATEKVDPSWGRAVDQLAKRALNDVIAQVPPDADMDLSPSILYKAGEGSMRDRKWGRAIRALQRTLVACEAEKDASKQKKLMDEYHTKVWTDINECYSRIERHREAFLAADQVVQRYLKSGRKDPDQAVGACAYYRMLSLKDLAQETKDAADEAAFKKGQEFFTKNFPWSDQIGGTAYVTAAGKLTQATRVLSREGVDAAKPKFDEAIVDFKKIPASDASYRKAQSRIGEAMVLMGNAAGALKHFQTFLQSNDDFFGDANTRGGLRQPEGWSIFWMANAFDEMKQYGKVVETLKDFESRFKDAELSNSFARVRFLRVTALLKAKNLQEAERQAALLRKESASSAWTTQACLAVANGLFASAAELAKGGDVEQSKAMQRRSVALYDFWVNNSTNPTAANYQFVGQLHFDIGDLPKATAMWEKALGMFEAAGEMGASENILIYLANILIRQERYADALPKFEALFVKKQKDLDVLREVYAAIELCPTGVDQGVHEKKTAEMIGKILDLAAGDDTALKNAAKLAISGGKVNAEKLVRAFDQSAESRDALAAATAFTVLGDSPTMNSRLRNSTFKLVKTSPDLMSGLARCYAELGQSKLEYPIRAINLYAMLIRAAKPSDGSGAPRPRGTRYSESWFDWKYQLCTVYFNLGSSLKLEDPLKTVCAYIKSMTTLDELARAEEERKGFEKSFQELRDKADSALRKIGKGGCE